MKNFKTYHIWGSLILGLLAFNLSAQQWQQQYPPFETIQMLDIDMLPTGEGAATGVPQTLLLTTDFGETWEPADFSGIAFIREVKIIMQDDQPVIWGLTGTNLIKSDDWGNSWVNMAITDPNIGSGNYLFLTDQTTIYAGGIGSIAKSEDAGETWMSISPDPDLSWTTIFFLDNDHGWAGTQEGLIYGTSDGGSTWTLLNDSTFEDPMSIIFYSTNKGYLAVNREFWETTDGGQTWTMLHEDAFGAYPTEMALIDENHIIGARGNAAYATEDGGHTWERLQPENYSYSNGGVCALPDGQAWVVGAFHMIAHSTDSGFSYTDQIPGNKNTLTVIDFVDEQNGWASGYNGSVLKTSNGGTDWEEVSVPDGLSSSTYEAIAVSSDEYWLSSSSDLFRTLDGGTTWDSMYNVNGRIYSMTQIGSDTYLATQSGKLYRGDLSSNTWEVLSSTNTTWLFDVQFPSEQVGYAVGRDGTLLKTSDGGDNWAALDAGTDAHFQSVFFKDDNTGWIMTSTATNQLLFTEDGGQTWNQQTIPVSTYWKNIKFVDDQKGYLVGGSANVGRVLMTMDGGTTWEDIYSDNSLFNGIATISNEFVEKVWICGQGGTIEYIDFLATALNETIEVKPLKVIPNPSQGIVNIQVPNEVSAKSQMRLHDLYGRLQIKTTVSPSLDLSSLPSGMYTLTIEDGQKVYRAKIMNQ